MALAVYCLEVSQRPNHRFSVFTFFLSVLNAYECILIGKSKTVNLTNFCLDRFLSLALPNRRSDSLDVCMRKHRFRSTYYKQQEKLYDKFNLSSHTHRRFHSTTEDGSKHAFVKIISLIEIVVWNWDWNATNRFNFVICFRIGIWKIDYYSWTNEMVKWRMHENHSGDHRVYQL